MNKNDLFDYENLTIMQNDDFFKFSLDSILLAEYVNKSDLNKKIIDLCTGNASIPLILNYYGFKDITGVELQPEIFDLAVASLKENRIDSVNIINDDVKNIKSVFKSESFDIVTVNPPYFKVKNEDALINSNRIKAIARHELMLNLDDLLMNASYLLINNGILYMVHRSERLLEIANIASKYRLAVKEVQLLTTNDSTYDMVLIKMVKNGNSGVKFKKILNVNNLKTYKNIFKEG